MTPPSAIGHNDQVTTHVENIRDLAAVMVHRFRLVDGQYAPAVVTTLAELLTLDPGLLLS